MAYPQLSGGHQLLSAQTLFSAGLPGSTGHRRARICTTGSTQTLKTEESPFQFPSSSSFSHPETSLANLSHLDSYTTKTPSQSHPFTHRYSQSLSSSCHSSKTTPSTSTTDSTPITPLSVLGSWSSVPASSSLQPISSTTMQVVQQHHRQQEQQQGPLGEPSFSAAKDQTAQNLDFMSLATEQWPSSDAYVSRDQTTAASVPNTSPPGPFEETYAGHARANTTHIASSLVPYHAPDISLAVEDIKSPMTHLNALVGPPASDGFVEQHANDAGNEQWSTNTLSRTASYPQLPEVNQPWATHAQEVVLRRDDSEAEASSRLALPLMPQGMLAEGQALMGGTRDARAHRSDLSARAAPHAGRISQRHHPYRPHKSSQFLQEDAKEGRSERNLIANSGNYNYTTQTANPHGLLSASASSSHGYHQSGLGSGEASYQYSIGQPSSSQHANFDGANHNSESQYGYGRSNYQISSGVDLDNYNVAQGSSRPSHSQPLPYVSNRGSGSDGDFEQGDDMYRRNARFSAPERHSHYSMMPGSGATSGRHGYSRFDQSSGSQFLHHQPQDDPRSYYEHDQYEQQQQQQQQQQPQQPQQQQAMFQPMQPRRGSDYYGSHNQSYHQPSQYQYTQGLVNSHDSSRDVGFFPRGSSQYDINADVRGGLTLQNTYGHSGETAPHTGRLRDGGAFWGQKGSLDLKTHLGSLERGWSQEEFKASRRLIRFERWQTGATIHANARTIGSCRSKDKLTISCIFRAETNECYYTSVDILELFEGLLDQKLETDDKNRIRRNLESFKPITVTKSKQEFIRFHKLIIDFPEPQPRGIDKDFKVFAWHTIDDALKKIVSRYELHPEGFKHPKSRT